MPTRNGNKNGEQRIQKTGAMNVANMLEAIAVVIADKSDEEAYLNHEQGVPRAHSRYDEEEGESDYDQHDENDHARRHSGRSRRASHPNHEDNDHQEEGEKDHFTGKQESKGDDEQGKEDPSKKKMPPEKKRRLIILGIIIGIIVIICAICFWLYSRQYETTDDAFVDGHISQISPQANGRIQTLLVDDNEQVQQGQLLVEIDPRDYQEKLSQVQAQHAQSVAQLGLQRANLGQARANVLIAKADLYQAEQDLKRYRSIDPQAITRQQLDNAIASDQSARAKLTANEQAVDAAKAQVEATQADIDQAKVAISNAKLQLSYTKITAPISGRITRRTVEIGNVVSQGQPLLAVVSNDLWITANYKETQLNHMQIGQKVQIQIDAFPDAVFSGHVDSFQKGSGSVFSTLPAENATGNYVKVVQRVPVKIVFDDPNQRDKYPLAPGLSVDPRVTVR